MSHTLARIILILGAASLLTSSTIVSQQTSAKFESPDVLSTSDIPYPPNTTVTGLVTLVLSLADTGRVQNVQVVRDTPPLTSAAQSSVQTWTCKPAQMNGQPVASQLPVNVVFNPYNPGGTEITGLAITPAPSAAGSSSFVPAQITAASYALYPADSLAIGTVVLCSKGSHGERCCGPFASCLGRSQILEICAGDLEWTAHFLKADRRVCFPA
jgi:hypothetical protein